MKTKFAIATIVMAFASAAWARDTDVEKLLSDMRAAYQKPATAKLTTEATVLNVTQKDQVVMQFEVTFKRPYNVYCKVIKFPGQEGKNLYWVTNGKILKSSTPEGIKKTKISTDEIGKGWLINLESLSFWDSDRQLSTKSGSNMEHSKFVVLENQPWNDKQWTVLEETAAGQDVFVRYFIDPTTFYIWRCEVWDIDKKMQYYDIQVKELEIDPPVDEKIFDITSDSS